MRPPGPAARFGLPSVARLRRRRGQPDHRGAPGLRAAGDACRHGPADHGPADGQLRAHHRTRACHHLARPGRGVLLRLPGGLLHHDLRLRRVRPRGGGACISADQTLARRGGTRMSSLAGLLGQPFLRYAFIAGAAIAAASGLTGYFVVLRSQVFTGDALSHVAVTGALAALAAGADLLIGLYGACIIVALAMAALGHRGQADDTVIGSVFAWILGLGALFLSIYTTSARNGTSGVNVLFGTIFGLSATQAVIDSALAAGLCAAAIVIARPLLFATIDEAVASARRVAGRAPGTPVLRPGGGAAAAAAPGVRAPLAPRLLGPPPRAGHR